MEMIMHTQEHELKLHRWLIDPQRLVEIIHNEDGYSLSWNTEAGDRLCVHEQSLDSALNKAHSFDTEPRNREARLRMAFTPTAKIQAWTTGVKHNDQYGWWGWVSIDSPMPEKLEFKTPVLPRGWKWDFSSNVNRRFKPSGYYGYLTEGDKVAENIVEGARFRFTVTAPHNIFIKKNDVLDVITRAIGEIERAHFIVS